MEDLKKKREELEKKYRRMFDAHSSKYSKHIASEGEYRDSAQKIKDLYKELYEVALQLGDPLPYWV
tara:strand:- start:916 stop:1113 length:198 start_codon:yes stop_codon:yes gene_type:complete